MQWYEKQVSVVSVWIRKELVKTANVDFEDHSETIQTGHVAIAAITSCTNTSNPYVLMAAGLFS